MKADETKSDGSDVALAQFEEVRDKINDYAESVLPDYKRSDDPNVGFNAVIEAFGEMERENAELATQVAEDADFAVIGRQYHENLIEDTVRAGVRARGDGFNEDMYRSMLAKLSVEEIRVMHEDFIREGDTRHGVSGTESGDDPPQRKTKDGSHSVELPRLKFVDKNDARFDG